MKIGLILHKIQDSNIFIVDVGWGQLRYFCSNQPYDECCIILYKEKSYLDWQEIEDRKWGK